MNSLESVPMSAVPAVRIGAFAESGDVLHAMRAVAGDRRMARAVMDAASGGLAAAVQAARGGASYGLIIAETGDAADEEMFRLLDELARECVEGTKVILVGARNDVGLYRDLVASGVDDYLVRPLRPQSLLAAVSRAYAVAGGRAAARVVAFVGSRGGAGSSTVAHNVACAAASAPDSRVFLADMDLGFGTVALDFNIEPANGVMDAVRSGSLDDTLVERMASRHGERLLLLASRTGEARGLTEAEAEAFVTAAAAGGGTVVFDLPGTWSAAVLKILSMADEIVLTATPDLASMRNAKHQAEVLARLRPNDAPPRLVLNQTGMPRRPEVSARDFTLATGLRVAASVAFDAAAFGKAANEGTPLAEMKRRHPASRTFARLAQDVAGRRMPSRPAAGFLSRLVGRSG